MRTTASSQWVWIFAGALPALSLGAGCGDDTTATTTGTSAGGFGGSGGDDNTTPSSSSASGSPTSSSSSSAQSSSQSSAQSQSASSGGDGGAPGVGGAGGAGGNGGAEPECGDGLINGDDECDGANLGDLDCESQGFAGGTLSCADDCTIDITECLTCGNGIVDGNDECDEGDLGGTTCEDLKFDGGTLGCNDDCSYDTLGCTQASCGDGQLNGDEDCEGVDLGGETCITLDFVGGTLGCFADGAAGECQFDTTQCLTCGNDVVDGADECDGDALDNQTCLTLDFTGGVLDCSGVCAFDTTGCTNFALPTAGQLVINELMQNPAALGDSAGEYFEVFNPTATTLQLRGCSVTGTGGGDDQFVIDTDLTVAPSGYATFARTAAAGFTGADFVWPNITGSRFALGNEDDGITITCAGVTVDEVLYDIGVGGWPNSASTNGRSVSLDPTQATSGANDTAANWCASATNSANYVSTDRGTPDNANPSCAGSTVAIADCHLQDPESIDDTEGTSVAIYGRVLSSGVTDVNQTGNDNNPAITAMVGWGANGADPATFTWSAATANAGYATGSPDFEPTFDEYSGTFSIPPAAGSPYDFAVRFSGNGGTTWSYCDLDGGAYSAGMAGAMISQASSSDYSSILFGAYVEFGAQKALQIYNRGTDTVDLSACSISLYSNGSATATSTDPLTGVSIVGGGNYVLCNSGASELLANCDDTSGAVNSSGDDTLALVCSSSLIDVIGVIGTDPGTTWGTSPEDTDQSILVRECTVTQGDTNGADAFDPAAQWIGADYTAAAANTALATHVCPP